MDRSVRGEPFGGDDLAVDEERRRNVDIGREVGVPIDDRLLGATRGLCRPRAPGPLGLGLLLGWVLFYSGITKVLDPSWTAAGYLEHAVAPGNPFGHVWPLLATPPATDLLVQWGLTLTGIGLIVGAFVRWNALCAAAMMVLFWASSLPLEHAILVDQITTIQFGTDR